MMKTHTARQAAFAIALVAIALAMFASMPCGNYFGFDVFGTNPPNVVTCDQPANGLFWLELTIIALALSVALVSAAWILNGVFGGPKYNEFLKERLWSMLETAVIMGIFIAMLVSLQQYGNDNLDTARAYTKIIRNSAVEDFGKTIAGTALFSFVSNANPKIHLFKGHFGSYIDFQLAPMFKPIFDMMGLIIQLQTTVVLQWFAHDYLLCFAKNYLLTLLLPVGLFLRGMGIKAAGNAMMGVAIALYFVYPFMIVQIGEIVTKHYENEISALTIAEGNIHLSLCFSSKPICCMGGTPDPVNDTLVIPNGNGFISVKKVLTNPLLGCSYSTTNVRIWESAGGVVASSAAFMLMKAMMSGSGTSSSSTGLSTASGFMNILMLLALFPPMVMLMLSFIYGLAYFFFIVSMVLPIFAIFITLTLAKEITKALGTEIDLSALEKLI